MLICRLVLPSDSNALNIIHGGVVLQMLEEAGHIVTRKYYNSEENRVSHILLSWLLYYSGILVMIKYIKYSVCVFWLMQVFVSFQLIDN